MKAAATRSSPTEASQPSAAPAAPPGVRTSVGGGAGGGSLMRKASSFFGVGGGNEGSPTASEGGPSGTPSSTRRSFASSSVHFVAMTEFKQHLFDSTSITRGQQQQQPPVAARHRTSALTPITPPSTPATPGGTSPVGMPDLSFLAAAATAGTNPSRALPQRPVDACEVQRSQLERFAFGESTRSPEAGELLAFPPYKLHVVPYHRCGRLVFVQLVLSTISYVEQLVPQPSLGPSAVITRLRKAAVCLVVTCFEERDYGLFMTNVGFLRSLLHRTIEPCVRLLARFCCEYPRATEAGRARVLESIHGDPAAVRCAQEVRDLFGSFLETRLLCPALTAAQPVCLPNVLQAMQRRPPSTLRATSTASNRQVAAASNGEPGAPAGLGAAAGVLRGHPVLSDSGLREALLAVSKYGTEFLSKVLAGCISASNFGSYHLHGDVSRAAMRPGGRSGTAAMIRAENSGVTAAGADKQPPGGSADTVCFGASAGGGSTCSAVLPKSPDQRTRLETVGRVVIATKDVTLARHLITLCCFFFRRDRTVTLEQGAAALLAHERLPVRGADRANNGGGGGAPDLAGSAYDYSEMLVPPLYAAFTDTLAVPAPIVWLPRDGVEDVLDALVDPCGVENVLLVVQPGLQRVQRTQIFRAFRVREGSFQCTTATEDLALCPALLDAAVRATQTTGAVRDVPVLRLLQEEMEYVHRQSRLYHAMLQSGVLPPWPEIAAMYTGAHAAASGLSPAQRTSGPSGPSGASASGSERPILTANSSITTPAGHGGPASATGPALASQRSESQLSSHSTQPPESAASGRGWEHTAAYFAALTPTGRHFHFQNMQLLWLLTLRPSMQAPKERTTCLM